MAIVIFLWRKINRLSKRIEELEVHLQHKKIVPKKQELDQRGSDWYAEELKVPIKEEEFVPVQLKPVLTETPKTPLIKREIITYESTAFGKTWEQIETLFIENWVGVLGALATVFGVGFLGVYTALKVAPLYRCVMISGFAGGLVLLSVMLNKKSYWQQFSFLLGSIGSALFLFVCLGAGGIPVLQWIHNPMHALIALMVGMVANLIFAFFAGKQWFYALHMVLSLTALGFAPANEITCFVAAMITVVYLLISFGKKWSLHQFVAITSMFIFNMIWYWDLASVGSLTFDEQMTGMMSSLMIGIISAGLHYQKIYRGGLSDESNGYAVFTHLANWLFIAAGLIAFSPGFIHPSIGLGVAAVILFITARIARYRGINWMYLIDTVMAQLLVMAAICSCYIFVFSYTLLFAAIFIECLLFYVVMHYEHEQILKKTAKFFVYLAEMMTIIGCFVCMLYEPATQWLTIYSGLAGLFLVGFAFYSFFSRHDSFDEFGNLLFALPAMLTYQLSFVDTAFFVYWEALIAGLLIIPLIAQRFLPSVSIDLVYVGMIGLLQVASWFSMWGLSHNLSFIEQFLKTLPVFSLLLLSCCFSYVAALQKNITWPYIYFFGASVLVYSYLILHNFSTLGLGVLWLIASLIFLEAGLLLEPESSLVTGSSGKHLLNLGMAFVGAFIGLHVLYHLQLEGIVGIMSVRLLMQLFAIGVFFYWLVRSFEEIKNKSYACIMYMQPLFLELIVVFVILAMALEIPYIYLAPSWMILAVMLLCIGEYGPQEYSRLRIYSLLLTWNAGIHLATITSTVNYPSTVPLWVIGAGIVIMQFFYLLRLTYKKSLQNIALPAPVAFFEPLLAKINAKQNSWIFYPFFITVAIFLFWRFDKSFLTLCWTLEVFGIFLLGILLKDNYFRTISLGALVVCAIRLIFYDLAQAETLARGIVFISFGGILLLMHALHNYFKDRK